MILEIPGPGCNTTRDWLSQLGEVGHGAALRIGRLRFEEPKDRHLHTVVLTGALHDRLGLLPPGGGHGEWGQGANDLTLRSDKDERRRARRRVRHPSSPTEVTAPCSRIWDEPESGRRFDARHETTG